MLSIKSPVGPTNFLQKGSGAGRMVSGFMGKSGGPIRGVTLRADLQPIAAAKGNSLERK
jgi:hypothetical protein